MSVNAANVQIIWLDGFVIALHCYHTVPLAYVYETRMICKIMLTNTLMVLYLYPEPSYILYNRCKVNAEKHLHVICV